MNLTKLFEMQKALDERIVREKGLEGQDLLPNKILALQVELGELANEWRGFKFWSNDRHPRTRTVDFRYVNGEGFASEGNPLLEEYVDCLHFILSIGLEIGVRELNSMVVYNCGHATAHFLQTFNEISGLFNALYIEPEDSYKERAYERVVLMFLGLGELLGFTWEEIEQAYLAKNAVNHERQATGY